MQGGSNDASGATDIDIWGGGRFCMVIFLI